MNRVRRGSRHRLGLLILDGIDGDTGCGLDGLGFEVGDEVLPVGDGYGG